MHIVFLEHLEGLQVMFDVTDLTKSHEIPVTNEIHIIRLMIMVLEALVYIELDGQVNVLKPPSAICLLRLRMGIAPCAIDTYIPIKY